jgi:uncharacterized protein (TIGR03084 family)
MSSLVTDLAAETEVIEQMLANRPHSDWELPTPAEGWLIRDQISHLAFFDDMARLSVVDPERFRARAKEHLASGMDFPDRTAAEYRELPVPELHAWFRRARLALITETGERDSKERVPWYGPSMSLASSITARIMETWAHGQDIADALGVLREPSPRLRHVAHIGVGARAYSFAVRGLPAPTEPVYVELAAPDGTLWTWGPEDAPDRIAGDALDFCLLVTQRRHRDELKLDITGPAAEVWMSIAQAFAGAAGPGRPAPVG